MDYGTALGQLGNTRIYVVGGDIARIDADAIMTAINPGGAWFGGIDGVIQRAAGNTYHRQAASAAPLKDLQTIVARGKKKEHTGQFDDVVFVVDTLESSLRSVVYAGLEASHAAKHSRLLIPTLRMGVMAGVVEKTPEATVESLAKGIRSFAAKYGGATTLTDIAIVVYNDQNAMKLLNDSLSSLKAN